MGKKHTITYNQAGFIKYRGKLFPRWSPEIWTVWYTETKGQGFRRYEEAVMYKAILDLKVTVK